MINIFWNIFYLFIIILTIIRWVSWKITFQRTWRQIFMRCIYSNLTISQQFGYIFFWNIIYLLYTLSCCCNRYMFFSQCINRLHNNCTDIALIQWISTSKIQYSNSFFYTVNVVKNLQFILHRKFFPGFITSCTNCTMIRTLLRYIPNNVQCSMIILKRIFNPYFIFI